MSCIFQKLYDDLPERLKITYSEDGFSFSLLADSESGVNELIDCLRPAWKNYHGTELEVNNSTTDGERETAMDTATEQMGN